MNDLGTALDGECQDQKAADLTVELIEQRGGTAVANYENVATFDGPVEWCARAT